MGPAVGALLVMRAAPGHSDDLAALITRMVALTREQHGPTYFGAARLADDPEVFVVFEEWPDQAAVAAHMSSPEYQDLAAQAQSRGLVASAEGALRLASFAGSPLWGARLTPLDAGAPQGSDATRAASSIRGPV